jgi:hypothetical protein
MNVYCSWIKKANDKELTRWIEYINSPECSDFTPEQKKVAIRSQKNRFYKQLVC